MTSANQLQPGQLEGTGYASRLFTPSMAAELMTACDGVREDCANLLLTDGPGKVIEPEEAEQLLSEDGSEAIVYLWQRDELTLGQKGYEPSLVRSPSELDSLSPNDLITAGSGVITLEEAKKVLENSPSDIVKTWRKSA